ncbi:MAG: efflux RND transporter periplasmic adaptor subunit [Dokdonella sp.]|uniref:efflux RND transporter periplasmic adaptor subunit n=1 Tax=Dokdonella sp. TaxID=2291710 RepID=UPI003BB183EA
MMRPIHAGKTVSVLLFAASLAACSSQAGVAEPERVARVAKVEPASLQAIEVYPGEVNARYESALGFRVAGKINTRRVDIGAHVSKGQILAELDPRDLELASSSAKASLASAQAAFQLAKSEHDRYSTLHQRNFVSQFDLEAKLNALEAARAHVAEARAALQTSQNQAGYAELRADADGVITAISGEAGQVVGSGQAIMTLAHDGTSEVEINVPEQAIAELKIGASAHVELWTESGRQHDAVVREIAPGADATTRTYRVRVAFDDPAANPRLGQTARVYFASAASDGQFLVPLSALYEKEGKPAIWQVDGKTHRVRLSQVSVANYGEAGALIDQGLAASDWIVTAGVHRLREGEVVNPIDDLNRRVSF